LGEEEVKNGFPPSHSHLEWSGFLPRSAPAPPFLGDDGVFLAREERRRRGKQEGRRNEWKQRRRLQFNEPEQATRHGVWGGLGTLLCNGGPVWHRSHLFIFLYRSCVKYFIIRRNDFYLILRSNYLK
jgi:hypothetical protein